MSRFGRKKNKEENKKIEPPESPLKGVKIYSPEIEVEKDQRKGFFSYFYDENYNPIREGEVCLEVASQIYDGKIQETGKNMLSVRLPPETWGINITYPNFQEYSPTVHSNIIVHEDIYEVESKPNVKLYAPSMTVYANNEPDYLVRLTDDEDNPISNEEISITVGEEEYIKTTNENGFASIFLKLTPDVYPITVKFEGNEKYDSIVKESELKVLLRNIDREVMINIENLTMEFKVSKDKIDTLKEYVIRTLKRNKKPKKKIRVLDDISFKIYKGERMGILGFNGAGKSTLLKILAGIYKPTYGTIETYGKIAPLLELGAGFDKNYTGENNIYLNGAFLSMTKDFIDAKYDEIVEFSELGEYIKYPVKNYSSGMRAKLGFSIATLVEPDILIVDEILSVGDIKFRKKSSEKIQSMMSEGVTVLLVSHSIEQIRSICDRCIWLENGKIVMEGEAGEVCNAYVESAMSKK